MKKMLILMAGILCFASLASAKLMLIDPAGDMYNVEQIGEEYIPVGEPVYSAAPSMKGDTTLIGIFSGSSGYYFPNRPKGSMNMQWFVPPAECKILEAHVMWYSAGDVSAYLWESPFPYKLGMTTDEALDSVMAHWVFDSTCGQSDTGWVTTPDVLHACMVDGLPFGSQTPDGVAKWDTLDFTGPAAGPIDVGADPFWFGYVIMDESGAGKPWPLSDPNAAAFIPCQTYQWRTDVYEWRTYGDLAGNWAMYILVDMYGDPAPEISSAKLADTYHTGPYLVEATITDNNGSIARAHLYWVVNPDSLPAVTYDSTELTGTYPDYTADIGVTGALVGDEIHYWMEAEDDSAKLAIWPALGRFRPNFFTVREKTAGNDILFVVGDDHTDEDTYTDALDLLHPTYDTWSVTDYGAPDSSVVNADYSAIIWGTYGGRGFAKSTKHLPQYMDEGGNLFLMGMDALAGIYGYDSIATEAGDFAKEYFHFDTIIDDYHPGDTLPSFVYGAEEDTIGGFFFDPMIWCDPMNTTGQDDWMGAVVTDGTPTEIFFDEGDVAVGWRDETAKGYKWVFSYFQYGSMADADLVGAVNYMQTRKLICNTLRWFGLTCDTPIDVTLFSVDNPTDGGKVLIDSTTAPIATVKNYGFEDAAEFDVECVVALLDSPYTALLTDTQTVAAGLAPYESEVVTFADWTVPSDSGVVYELTYTTMLATDQCAGNDVQVIEVTGMPVGVELIADVFTFQLFQNRPNPAVKGINILYSIPKTEKVTLKVYNRVGQCVRTLVNDESQAAGLKTVSWNGTDRKGTRLPSGVYFYTLTAGPDKAGRKFVLVK